jgi:hypothetical protein
VHRRQFGLLGSVIAYLLEVFEKAFQVEFGSSFQAHVFDFFVVNQEK